jgi:hypothetical protein
MGNQQPRQMFHVEIHNASDSALNLFWGPSKQNYVYTNIPVGQHVRINTNAVAWWGFMVFQHVLDEYNSKAMEEIAPNNEVLATQDRLMPKIHKVVYEDSVGNDRVAKLYVRSG